MNWLLWWTAKPLPTHTCNSNALILMLNLMIDGQSYHKEKGDRLSSSLAKSSMLERNTKSCFGCRWSALLSFFMCHTWITLFYKALPNLCNKRIWCLGDLFSTVGDREDCSVSLSSVSGGRKTVIVFQAVLHTEEWGAGPVVILGHGHQ